MGEYATAFNAAWVGDIVASQLGGSESTGQAACEVQGPLYERSNSRVYRLGHPKLPGPAAVKLCLEPYTLVPDGGFAREQFETLGRTRAALSDKARLSVPEPYFLVEEHGLLGMEWIAGVDMTTALFASGCRLAQAQCLLERAGGWLRQFHHAGPMARSWLDTEYRLAQLEDNLAPRGVAEDRIYLRAISRARATAAEAGAAPLDSSWIHGDFKTDNLMVAGERTIGLDINARHRNTVFHDIAPFLNHLDLKLLHPRAWRFAGRRDRLVQTFLDGYGLPGDGATRRALSWARLVSMLAVWQSVAERQHTLPSAWAARLLFRRATSRLTGDLDRC